MKPYLLVTPGEPAGIGPDITILAAQQHWDTAITAVCSPQLLHDRAKQLHLPLTITEVDSTISLKKHVPGHLNVLPVALRSTVTAKQLDPANAAYVIESLTLAANLANQKQVDAIVTGPVHKGIINQAGIPFTGHTEFFAEKTNSTLTVMLFVVNQLKVALATTHLPLASVPEAITRERLIQTLTVMHQDLQSLFKITSPRILVAGLNPHAGEQGYLGREEIDTIEPALHELRNQGLKLIGPLPADTIFTQDMLQEADAILAMYHDQALPIVKYLGFHHAVNVTLGLHFIRTSVDHGTAIDLAGTGRANAGSMEAAIRLAIALAQPSSSD